MNKIGEAIDIHAVLSKYNNEPGCGLQSNILQWLGCQIGETYVVFDDFAKIHFGQLCKVKKDVFTGYSLAAFDKNDDYTSQFNDNCGSNGNAIVYVDNYKYMIRIN